MMQVFQFACGNELRLSHTEEVAFPKEGSVLEMIGMFFHYIQQTGGSLYINGVQVYALSMADTAGVAMRPGDYVGLDMPVTEVATIQSLLK